MEPMPIWLEIAEALGMRPRDWDIERGKVTHLDDGITRPIEDHFRLFHPDDAPAVRESWNELVAGEIETVETIIRIMYRGRWGGIGPAGVGPLGPPE